MLSRLLYSHVRQAHPKYTVLHVTWIPIEARLPSERFWDKFLCSHSNDYPVEQRVDSRNLLSRSNLVIVIDEAQLSYAKNDQSIWVECLKTQSQSESGPYFVLFSSFGSATNTALEIAGSAPITLERVQRVSLIPQPDWPHDISLCFTPEEVQDLCSRMVGNRNFTVAPDVLEHLFIQTNGHPGLTRALLRYLFELPVSTSPVPFVQVRCDPEGLIFIPCR